MCVLYYLTCNRKPWDHRCRDDPCSCNETGESYQEQRASRLHGQLLHFTNIVLSSASKWFRSMCHSTAEQARSSRVNQILHKEERKASNAHRQVHDCNQVSDKRVVTALNTTHDASDADVERVSRHAPVDLK